LWIHAAIDSARNEEKVPLGSIIHLARQMDQWSRRVKAKVLLGAVERAVGCLDSYADLATAFHRHVKLRMYELLIWHR
jgi:hypothetical protein